ncbi:MAG TPA: hypothetical protein VD966_05260 [Pyrinomonadaceae bacterium]|nr:hypothetical protein [Pyrinomonadaceae bacterium]
MADQRSRNRALVRFILLPLIFLTVALLGGLRVSSEERVFIFIAPPLITLVLTVLLMILFVRGHLIEIQRWVSSDLPTLTNVSHALTLLTLFFASAQAFNSVLPERGLLHWLFSFFFLWTLWNNQFSSFDARRLLRSLVVLFGTAFVLKHMLLASLYAPDGGWLKRLTGALLEGVTLGTLDAQAFAPSTGYISFFTLALYVAGLLLLPPAPERDSDEEADRLVRAYRRLSPLQRLFVREAVMEDQLDTATNERALPQSATAEPINETSDSDPEEMVARRKPESL